MLQQGEIHTVTEIKTIQWIKVDRQAKLRFCGFWKYLRAGGDRTQNQIHHTTKAEIKSLI